MLAQATIRGRFRSRAELQEALLPVKKCMGFGFVTVWYGHGPWRMAGHAGEVKILAHPKLLLVDWDHKNPPCFGRLADILRNIGITPEWIRLDRTVKGWHVIVKLTRSLEKGETVAMQLLLGSDPRREAFNLCRALSGVKSNRWNLLFVKKLK